MLIIKHHNPSTAYRGRTWRLLEEHGNGTVYNPQDFSTIRLPRLHAGPSHFCSNLVWTVPFFFPLSLRLCVPNSQMLTWSLIYLPSASYFPTMPTGKTGSTKKHLSMYVCEYVLLKEWGSVNPFCQFLAQPFLSKLPAWSQSPLC